jgi:FKBP-type peptidyl-prolyl cis-trans isomerase FkpA
MMYRHLYVPLFVSLLVSLFLSSCQKRENTEDEMIRNYIESHNLPAQKTEDGIYFLIETEGNGKHPNLDSKVTVNYRGYFLDDKEFDNSKGTPITFNLFQVIEGWQIGIPLLSVNGKGKLWIPSRYGYGKNPPSGIPKNAVLVFDVELLDVIP